MEIQIDASNKIPFFDHINQFIIIPRHNVRQLNSDKPHNNLLISSLNNPWLIQDTGDVKMKFYDKSNAIDITEKFIGSTYYIVAGGMRIYNATYMGADQSLYPVVNIPFGQLTYHNLMIYFDILDTTEYDLFNVQLRFYFSPFMPSADHSIIDIHLNGRICKCLSIPWFNNNKLVFSNGCCCLRQASVYYDKKIDSIDYEKYKIIHLIDDVDVDLNNSKAINALVENDNTPDKFVIVFERLSYGFVVCNDEYNNDKICHYMSDADAISNFKIISSCRLITFPIVTYNNTEIVCDREKFEENQYNYSSKSLSDEIFINNVNYREIIKILNIKNLVPNTYIFQFDRIFLSRSIRRNILNKYYNSDSQIVKIADN